MESFIYLYKGSFNTEKTIFKKATREKPRPFDHANKYLTYAKLGTLWCYKIKPANMHALND